MSAPASAASGPLDVTTPPTVPAVAWKPVLLMGGALGVVLLAVSARYGYHRDELYFRVAGRHLAWGYPDQPPLLPVLVRAITAVFGDSLVALRVPSALLAACGVLVAALTAREMGGGRRAQLLRWLADTPQPVVNADSAETVGWPRFAARVAAVRDALPPGERAAATIVVSNYGEAGRARQVRARPGASARLQRPQRLLVLRAPAGRTRPHDRGGAGRRRGRGRAAPVLDGRPPGRPHRQRRRPRQPGTGQTGMGVSRAARAVDGAVARVQAPLVAALTPGGRPRRRRGVPAGRA
ncbi:glycosyltransferase family 39 protein [Actinomadura madurae]|uniref:ArnT family glycosyltransferase n=1 Tax=Actinomadura madurae TaxID=1993 RepID=UPI0020D21121|nr:glycosyltransferase family 39 protein [Actinomadura madurae]MCP9949715.1 glycosyltransferase family 39 protein [Actinomadura madurae]